MNWGGTSLHDEVMQYELGGTSLHLRDTARLRLPHSTQAAPNRDAGNSFGG